MQETPGVVIAESRLGELHVVLGGTGGAGASVVRELAANGKRVRAASRRRHNDPEVEWVVLDARQADDVKRACAGASVVYHCANVPYRDWEAQLPVIADAVIAAAAAAGATLVVMDNLYMYGPVDGPMTEATPRRPVGHKGRLRSELEKKYLSAHRSGTVRLTIGRASDFYGAFGLSAPLALAIDPMLQGKRASWIANLDAPHTLSYLPDVARGLITLGERSEALGQIWHIPAAEPLTGRQFITMAAEAIGRHAEMSRITLPMMWLAGLFDAQIREATEVYYQFAKPFVIDAAKFTNAFGGHVTAHREAIPVTVEERRRRPAGSSQRGAE
ncbi:MAG TPA: NAD-dependent epimerase/dehydratase family protein [Candidatus Tumulicola sp.]|nr:NAD-dependent epimerase/dehydratase family protein [Candidatus Tumulicola sp.]